MRIKLVTFYTEGPPHDGGLSLTSGIYAYRELAVRSGLEFSGYTPRKLRGIGADELVKEYPDKYKLSVNQNLHKIGFAAWKPFIILDAMRDLEGSKNSMVLSAYL